MNAYSTYTDHELLALLKQGDELAFAELYNRHWDILFHQARKVLRDTDEAKDMVQELFMSFWSKAECLDVKTNLKGYFYRALRNRILNHIRNKKVNHDFIEVIARQMDESDDSLSQNIDEKELIQLIDEEIARLPPKMKLAFEMSRKEFLSNKEIAARLGISEDAVKQQISRSLKTLKLQLSKYSGLSIFLIAFMHQRQ